MLASYFPLHRQIIVGAAPSNGRHSPLSASPCGGLITLPWTWERNVVLEGIAPLGTLDLQHAITQLVKALADPARAFAFVRHRNGSSAPWFREEFRLDF